jgi:general secretion pathway protein F
MVGAGEAAGTLESVLQSLAEMTETQTKLIGKVKSAMVYPLFMAIMGVAVVVFIFAFVVPSLTKLFLEMNRPLPWPTVLLIRSSGFMERYFFVLAAVLGIVAAIIVFWLRTTHGRIIGDQLKLRIPLLGSLMQRMAVSRFSRTLAILLSSGLSIVEALELSKRVIGNMVISTAVDDAKDAISRGDRIADAFQKGGIFPPILIHMIAAGEKSGGIEEGLGNIADAFDSEVETSVKTLTSLLEPAMIVLLGIIVGFIVLAILLPIFDINQAIV